MKRFILSAALSVFALPVVAQSWSYEADRVIAPQSISGDNSPGFEIVCYQGEWMMYLFGLPTAEGTAATISIDGQAFPVQIIYGNGSDGIELSNVILEALKSGNSVRVSSTNPSSRFDSTYGLRGSSRALSAVEARCGTPTPASDAGRFRSPSMESTSEAISLASALLRPILAEAHKYDRGVGIGGANIVDLDNGWQFLIADIGPSTALYGIAAFESVVAAKAPTGDWQIVAQQVGVAVYIDSKGTTNGFPDIWYQNVRGVGQPYGVWQWNGREYAFSRNIQN